MTRILAIEPDPERGVTLRRLVRQNLNADVVLTTSTDGAIAAMGESAPDLIVTSSLIGPRDEQRLAAHLKQTPALRYLPMLTISPLVDASGIFETRQSGLIARLMRRRPRTWQTCDFEAVAERVKEALEQAQIAAAARREEGDSAIAPLPIEAALVPELVGAPSNVLQMTPDDLRAYCGLGAKQKRAQRWTSADLPWLSSVKLTWGLELRLLNISRSGLLVESGIRLTPGSRTAIHLGGPNNDLIVPARVVRSRVSTVNPLGVKYVAAAEFEQPFDALTPADAVPESPADPAEHLAELVARVRAGAASGARPVDLRSEFEAGVQELVSAREIRLREAPVVENDGRESIYFTIPTHDQSPAILQVTFEPSYQPQAGEFDALKAASVAAADVLQFTELTRQVSLAAGTEAPLHQHSTPRSPNPIGPTNVVQITSARELRRTG